MKPVNKQQRYYTLEGKIMTALIGGFVLLCLLGALIWILFTILKILAVILIVAVVVAVGYFFLSKT